MFTDGARYLFNCGEGTQRLAHEHKMKLSRLEHIFITEASWRHLGGLPGVALTVQDVGVPQLTLHGPEGLVELFEATHRFVVLRDLQIRTASCNTGETYEDHVMSMTYVPLTSDLEDDEVTEQTDVGEKQQEDEVDYYAHERGNTQSTFKASIPLGRRTHKSVMCYVCRLRARPGALDIRACAARRVPPGPLLGLLKTGEDVRLSNGELVRSIDVRKPDEPGPVLLVVDCPHERYLDALLEDKTLRAHQASACRDEDLAHLVVHFTCERILRSERYRSWLERFSPSTRHLVLNEANHCLGSASIHRQQYQLGSIAPDVFPLLRGTLGRVELMEETTKRRRLDGPLLERPATLCKYVLRPTFKLDTSEEVKLTPDEYEAEALAAEGFATAREEVHVKLAEARTKLGSSRAYPQLTFFGTGSCIPNKTRNVSGLLVRVNQNCSVLLDCGEGTLGQLVRNVGLADSRKELCKLCAIFISHMHADHHLGLLGVLLARRRALHQTGIAAPPITLIAPRQLDVWLRLYDRRFERVCAEYKLLPCDMMVGEMGEEVWPGLHVRTTAVVHCPHAWATRLSADGWSLTYSGDTSPSASLVELGQNTDLLVHEATMEDELSEEAARKMHSTVSQALAAGRAMQARHVLLTHFSQRYAKLPRLGEDLAHVAVAFDHLCVTLDELPLLPLLAPALRTLFAQHCDELEQKALKRQLKTDRLASRKMSTEIVT